MAVVPLTRRSSGTFDDPSATETEEINWARVAAAGTLVAGGVLLLAGHKRAALVTATAGAALTVLDQQDTVRAWWDVLPTYIDKVQRVLTRVEGSVMELAEQRDRLHKILTR
jgi:hypothetical protein